MVDASNMVKHTHLLFTLCVTTRGYCACYQEDN